MPNFPLKKIESLHTLWAFSRSVFSDSWRLYRVNFYKMTEFQLLFKMIYFSIIFWGLSYVINIAINVLSLAAQNITLSQIAQQFQFLSAFHFKSLLILILWITIILYIYFIERTGITYMSERYYKNLPVSFFRTLRRALQRTPKVIVAKLYERRTLLFGLIALYIIQVVLSALGASNSITNFFSTLLTIAVVLFLLTLIFLNGFTVHVACLNRKESAFHFKKKLSWSFNQRRYFTLTVFYTIMISAVLLIIAGYWGLIKSLIAVTANSTFLLSFLIAFSFFVILVVWSLIKSLRVDITTILYIRARQELHLSTPEITPMPNHHRRHSQKPLTGIIILVVFIVIMSFITMSPVESGITNIYEFAQNIASYNEAMDARDQEIIAALRSLLDKGLEWLKELFT